MATAIIMPKAGMAMERGTVIRWLKKPGEFVEAGEPLLEIETDKVAMEVEAEVSGYLLKILHDEGDEVDVITTIAYLGEKGEIAPDDAAIPATAAATDGPLTRSTPATTPDLTPTGSAVTATPSARRRARETGVELTAVSPSGRWGEIRVRDIEKAVAARAGGGVQPGDGRVSPVARKVAQQHGIDPTAMIGTGPGGRVMKPDVLRRLEGSGTPEGRSPDTAAAVSRRPFSGMRRRIADRVLESHRTIPPVTLNKPVDVTGLFSFRAEINAQRDAPISLNAYFVRAAAIALHHAPIMRTFIDGEELVQTPEINVGFAVALDDGLLVPVVHGADKLSLAVLSLRMKSLIDKARARTIGPDELTGGTFTITNLGMYGISSFTPIINPPESAILGVNAAEDRLTLVDGQVRSSKVITLSLTIDHRIIDGAQGAQFLGHLGDLLETPLRLMD